MMKYKMFIYIFLFLIGFNVLVWSFGICFLSECSIKRFELGTIFSPPVLATIISLVLAGIGVDKFIPEFISTFSTKINAINLRRPTLDDAFLKLTGHEIRVEQASAKDQLKQQMRMRRH